MATEFESWLEFSLGKDLGPLTNASPKGLPRYRAEKARLSGKRLVTVPRAAVAGFVAAFALTSGGAMVATLAGNSSPSGASVSQQAHQCPHPANNSTTCVSSLATTHGNKSAARSSAIPSSDGTTTSSAQNHGATVSAAAKSCPTGAHGVHGKCVSTIAKQNNGHTNHVSGSGSSHSGGSAHHGRGPSKGH